MPRIVRCGLIQAANSEPVESPIEKIKKAMIEIFHALNNGSWKAKMILQIHDELLFEAPENECKKLSVLVKEKMEGALKLKAPLVVDVGIGNDWLSAKD